jgi:AraC-like DNA-binding protein
VDPQTEHPTLKCRGRLISTYAETGTDLFDRHSDERGLVLRSLRLYEGASGFIRDDPSGSTYLVVQVFSDLIPCADAELDAVLGLGELSMFPQAALPTLALMRDLANALVDDSYPSYAIEVTWARGLGTLVQKLTGVTPPPDAVNRARIAQAERVIERFSGDSRLSPESLADALAISRRTLYGLETAFPGGIGEQIRLARISAACRLLSDPEWAGATVETIARRSGFSSAQRLRRALASVGLESPEKLRAAAGVGYPQHAGSRPD